MKRPQHPRLRVIITRKSASHSQVINTASMIMARSYATEYAKESGVWSVRILKLTRRGYCPPEWREILYIPVNS